MTAAPLTSIADGAPYAIVAARRRAFPWRARVGQRPPTTSCDATSPPSRGSTSRLVSTRFPRMTRKSAGAPTNSSRQRAGPEHGEC